MLWHIQRSLLADQATAQRPDWPDKIKRLKRLAAAILVAATKMASRIAMREDIVDIGRDALNLVEECSGGENRVTSQDAYMQCELRASIEKEFHTIGGELLGGDNDFDRIVVPIDDMDRCRPEAAVRLLFALINLMVSKHFTFIVAIDRQALAKFLSYTYGRSLNDGDAAWFLEKIFDDWVELPPPRSRMILRKMRDIDYFSPLNSTDFVNKLEEMGIAALSHNPRRFLRAVGRFRRLMDSCQPGLPCRSGCDLPNATQIAVLVKNTYQSQRQRKRSSPLPRMHRRSLPGRTYWLGCKRL
jgi:hypothetical protein